MPPSRSKHNIFGTQSSLRRRIMVRFPRWKQGGVVYPKVCSPWTALAKGARIVHNETRTGVFALGSLLRWGRARIPVTRDPRTHVVGGAQAYHREYSCPVRLISIVSTARRVRNTPPISSIKLNPGSVRDPRRTKSKTCPFGPTKFDNSPID